MAVQFTGSIAPGPGRIRDFRHRLLTESSLRNWVEQARADRTKGKTGLTTAEREELARLRKEVRELRMERDVLKKAAAFFARDHL